MVEERSEAERRRAAQRRRLIDVAEATIAQDGIAALRARCLAETVGCSVGAIYNLVGDLDELVLLVAQRTFADLGAALDAAMPASEAVDDRFRAWALAYLAFARTHRNRWRALFEHRMSDADASLPVWFAADQDRLFDRLEAGLRMLCPTLSRESLKRQARTLFSAVHGIVALGLEGKLVALPADAVATELESFLACYLAGVSALSDQIESSGR